MTNSKITFPASALILALLLTANLCRGQVVAILGTGCSLDLRPDVGGACDFINQQFVTREIVHESEVMDKGGAFGIDANGNCSIKVTISTIPPDGGGPGSVHVSYDFNMRDVEIVPFANNFIGVRCVSDKCITLHHPNGSGLQLASTTLISGPDPNTIASNVESLRKLSLIFRPKGNN